MVFAVGGVLITAAAIALWTPWFGLVDLREVVIRGNRHAAAADLVSLAGLRRGQSLFALSPRRVRADLLEHPWVMDASVERSLPHTLVLHVEEREEVAWMQHPSGEGCLTVAEGGVVVSNRCPDPDALIELRGARLSGDGAGARLLDPALSGVIERLRSNTMAFFTTRRIDVTASGSVELRSADGLRVLLGSLDRARSRLDALAALDRSLDLAQYRVIDLRFGGEATLVPR